MTRHKNTGMPMGSMKKAGGGGVQTSADTARKLASEMGGMKKGGKPKSGLAVMIAIGAPVKEKATGEMYSSKKAMAKHEAAESAGMERMERMKGKKMMDGGSTPAIKSSDLMAKGGGMKPVKKAQGGAAKVRKGMMTPEGKIIHAMNKIRGK